jgi:hypothetical protein
MYKYFIKLKISVQSNFILNKTKFSSILAGFDQATYESLVKCSTSELLIPLKIHILGAIKAKISAYTFWKGMLGFVEENWIPDHQQSIAHTKNDLVQSFSSWGRFQGFVWDLKILNRPSASENLHRAVHWDWQPTADGLKFIFVPQTLTFLFRKYKSKFSLL